MSDNIEHISNEEKAWGEERAWKVVLEIVEDIGLEQKILSISYRLQWQDYQIILDNESHCELREKLINVYFSEKNTDVYREIAFRLQHPTQFEDWE
ncbi:MAG: hypothetical protein KAJ18_08215 [Candidatus Omnitrophica bacterium]|nr:hypothetical protein [Candidatus Omnitrophota bacterium]